MSTAPVRTSRPSAAIAVALALLAGRAAPSFAGDAAAAATLTSSGGGEREGAGDEARVEERGYPLPDGSLWREEEAFCGTPAPGAAELRRLRCDPESGLAASAFDPRSPAVVWGGGMASLISSPRRDPSGFTLADIRFGRPDALASAFARLVGDGADPSGVEARTTEAITDVAPRLTATLTRSGHARLGALLEAWRAHALRAVAVDLRLLDVPAGDPLLDPLREGSAGVASAEDVRRILATAAATEDLLRKNRHAVPPGPRLLFAERRRGAVGAPMRFERLRRRALQGEIAVNQTGAFPVAFPQTIEVEEGPRIEVCTAIAPQARGVRIGVRALDVSLEDVSREAFRESALEHATTGDRSAFSVADAPSGRTSVFVLGPRLDAKMSSAPARHVVLLVSATLEPAPEVARGPLEEARLEEISGLVFDPYEGDGARVDADALVAAWRAAAGLEDSEGALCVLPGAVALLEGPPPVLEKLARGRALLEAAAPRAHRVDAWLLFGELGASGAGLAGGAIGAAPARDLLARAAQGKGLVLAATFGGGALADGGVAARSRVRASYTGGVDAFAGGTGAQAATTPVPVCKVVESGFAFTARLGATPSGGIVLEAKAQAQRARLEGTARARVEPGVDVDVRLPLIDRLEAQGRADLPAAGGYALFSAGAADLDGGPGGEVLLLVRVTPP